MKFLVLFFLVLVGVVFVYDGGMGGMDMIKFYFILGVMIGLGIVVFGGVIGMGNVVVVIIIGIVRNLGVGGKLFIIMFVVMVMIEA